jgi:hypothetical protein
MSDLDENLKKAFRDAGIEEYERVPAAADLRVRLLPLVKQAFIDAGWVNARDYEAEDVKGRSVPFEVLANALGLMTAQEWEKQAIENYSKYGWVKTPSASMSKEGWIEVSTDRGVHHNGIPLMTGQEWYDRFERNLRYDTKSYSRQCEDCGAPHNWEEAAKKAAGIE